MFRTKGAKSERKGELGSLENAGEMRVQEAAAETALNGPMGQPHSGRKGGSGKSLPLGKRTSALTGTGRKGRARMEGRKRLKLPGSWGLGCCSWLTDLQTGSHLFSRQG